MRKFAFLLALSWAPWALATVSVSAPANGSSVATTVQYVASATTSCAAGVSAIGIYSAPGDLAYTTPGNHLNTELFFNPGTYNTVVQEWDNCGGSSTTPVTIHVSGAAGGQVTVTAPETNSHGEFDGAICGVGQYLLPQRRLRHGSLSRPRSARVHQQGAQLNALLTFSPGVYHTVVQEWDNCGGSSTAPVTITVGGGSTSSGNVLANLQQKAGWSGYGPAASAIQYV